MDHDHGSLSWIIILWIIISHHWSWLNDHDHYHIGSSSWIVMFLQWKWSSVMEIMFLWPNDPFSLIIPCKLHECNVVTGPFIPLLSMEGHCCQWHGSIVVNFNYFPWKVPGLMVNKCPYHCGQWSIFPLFSMEGHLDPLLSISFIFHGKFHW